MAICPEDNDASNSNYNGNFKCKLTSKLSAAKSELDYKRCEMNLETFALKFASRKFHDMADNTWYLLVILTSTASFTVLISMFHTRKYLCNDQSNEVVSISNLVLRWS